MKQKTFLLINPWIYDFAAFDMWAKPLGLLTIASRLRLWGARVRLWDAMTRAARPGAKQTLANRPFGTGKYLRTPVAKPSPLARVGKTYSRYGLGPEVLAEELKHMDRPDGVLITSLMTYWYRGVFEAIEEVKKAFPGVPVILGGIYATLCSGHARRFSEADYVFPAGSEEILPDVLWELCGFKPQEFHAEKHEEYPAFDLLPKLDYICLLTSHGCPFSCHYCASKLLTGPFRQRKAEDVVEEILYWRDAHSIRDVAFYDDALLVNAENHITPILEQLAAKPSSLRFHTPNGLHLREITPGLARLMRRAGVVTVRLGYESSDIEWHRRTGGKIIEGDLENALRSLWDAGFTRDRVGVYVLIGLPGQRLSEAEDAVRTVKALGARCYLSEYSPIPGTDLWPRALENSAYDLEKEPLYHNNSLLPCGGGEFTDDEVHRLKRLRDER